MNSKNNNKNNYKKKTKTNFLKASKKKIILLTIALLTFVLMIMGVFAITNISNCDDLQNMKSNLSENYVLTQTINCFAYPDFERIGNSTNPFTGSFDGIDYAITNLQINSTDFSNGLFIEDSFAQVKNLRLINFKINEYNFGWVFSKYPIYNMFLWR